MPLPPDMYEDHYSDVQLEMQLTGRNAGVMQRELLRELQELKEEIRRAQLAETCAYDLMRAKEEYLIWYANLYNLCMEECARLRRLLAEQELGALEHHDDASMQPSGVVMGQP